MASKKIIGERIKFYRTKRGLTQRELEEILGVASRYVSSIEQGKRAPGLQMQIKICHYFGISMADLLPLDTPPELSAKDKIINDIVAVCRTLDEKQIGIVKTMVCAFNIS